MTYNLTDDELEIIRNAPGGTTGEPIVVPQGSPVDGFQRAMGFDPTTRSYRIDGALDTMFSALDRDQSGGIDVPEMTVTVTRLAEAMASHPMAERFLGPLNLATPAAVSVLQSIAQAIVGIFGGNDNNISRQDATAIGARFDTNNDRHLDAAELRQLVTYYRGEVSEGIMPFVQPLLSAARGGERVPVPAQ